MEKRGKYAGDGVALVGTDVEAVLALLKSVPLLVRGCHHTLDVLHCVRLVIASLACQSTLAQSLPRTHAHTHTRTHAHTHTRTHQRLSTLNLGRASRRSSLMKPSAPMGSLSLAAPCRST
jgi:hypothetical protein